MEILLALHQQWPWFWPLWGGVLGAVLGSFAGCMRDRTKLGLGLRQPPSCCLNCLKPLGVIDLIPVFSWLALRGKCRFCCAPIPATLLGFEVAGAVMGATLVWWLLR